MPIYEFRCKKCNAHLEVYQKFSDKKPTRCRKCGGRLEKLISAAAVQFKARVGTSPDYARKEAPQKKPKRNCPRLSLPRRRQRQARESPGEKREGLSKQI
jgi:putative FmdB family regulatory protein